jgi:UDP-N-acetylmuramoyl-L-alanyl-D-glutamate--2,6-diaminopimelate ligase
LQSDFSSTLVKIKFKNKKTYEVRIPFPCRHNVLNALAAIGACLSAQIDFENIINAIESLPPVKGRLEPVTNNKNIHILIDYAHTPDALENVLKSLSDIRNNNKINEESLVQTNSKIICVFGCGGDRDPGKRPLMGQVAYKWSDIVVITSDNPRSEDPNKIIQEIEQDLPSSEIDKKIFIVVDRKLAIKKALEMSSPHDVVLISGKGHEEFQVIGQNKVPFSDANIAKEFLD